MNIIESKSEHISQGKWTAKMEEQYNTALLKEKRKLFAEMQIPFPSEIEAKFADYISKGNKHADIYLENICHSYIQYAFDHYAEVLYQKLIADHGSETVNEREMRKILGKYGAKELERSGLVKFMCLKNGYKVYAL